MEKYIWGLFYVDIVENRFVKTVLGVSAEQRNLIKYAKKQAESQFELNSHFDKSKGVYRIEDMSDYYGAKVEVFRNFPFLIEKVYEIA